MAVAAPPPGRPAAQEALTYVKIALIFFLIAFIIYLLFGIWGLVTWFTYYAWWAPWIGWYAPLIWPVVELVLAFLALFGYFYVRSRIYAPLLAGNVHAAHAACVVGIVFGFIFGFVIAGILLILAYMKLGEAVAAPPPAPPPPPPPPAPATTS
ncbi:MAG TPA: hypothetical protein ENF34_02845 [Candidatus Bathyarchaeota archaeon]|nr:hypothetical protein [Candidatus Bathyarchaeota archaeon]